MEDMASFAPPTSDKLLAYQTYLQPVLPDFTTKYQTDAAAKTEQLMNNKEAGNNLNVNLSTFTTFDKENVFKDSYTNSSIKLKKEPSDIFIPDKEFDFLFKAQRKKAISLKIGKSKGKNCEKKVVRFSDALGLELTSIRHVFDADEPPCVPESAMKDLKVNFNEQFIKYKEVKKLCICFSSPENCLDFNWRVQENKVLLESCSVNDSDNSIHGSIRVLNIAFEKNVAIRYTLDNWLNYHDMPALYESSVLDGNTDRFNFSIYLPESFEKGNFLQFSIKYSCNNEIFWDNNFGSNYMIECYIGNKFY